MDLLLRGISAFFALWFLVVFLLLVHETGHLIALAHYKLKPDKVVIGNIKIFALNIGGIRHEFGLLPFFAFTISNAYAKAALEHRVIVALAGPFTSFVLGGGLYLCNYISPGWYTAIAANASIALGIFNLIPFPPMDGWPALEWYLVKNGMIVNEKGRAVLLGLGLISIGVLTFFTMG